MSEWARWIEVPWRKDRNRHSHTVWLRPQADTSESLQLSRRPCRDRTVNTWTFCQQQLIHNTCSFISLKKLIAYTYFLPGHVCEKEVYLDLCWGILQVRMDLAAPAPKTTSLHHWLPVPPYSHNKTRGSILWFMLRYSRGEGGFGSDLMTMVRQCGRWPAQTKVKHVHNVTLKTRSKSNWHKNIFSSSAKRCT